MATTANTEAFLSLVRHPLKFRMFLFAKLPSAFFSGVRVRSISLEAATVAVPFTWFSQNPFRSTYFACLAMAAEMSTGLLAMLYTYKMAPGISMLVVGLEAQYYKKAINTTMFSCTQGQAFREAVALAIKTGEGQTVRAVARGTNEDGELVAEFYITWSFRQKSI